MICNNDYTINCCGTITRFDFYAKTNGFIEFMIWRPQSDGTTYDLVWSVNEIVSGVDPNVGGRLDNMFINKTKIQYLF